MSYHEPALLSETLNGLITDTNGTYVDVTFGGGGHSKAILAKLSSQGTLFAFDQDEDVRNHLPQDSRFNFIDSNFRFMKNHLRMQGVHLVNGILADLGVSFHQFDTAERGFSIRFDGPLDMRMGSSVELTAADVLNTYEEEELARMFYFYGELKNSRKIAYKIVSQRKTKKLETIAELLELVEGLYPQNQKNKFLARLFQAIRIEVNDEIAALKAMLNQSVDLLSTGGRLAVISYHSLEDRLVKNFMKTGNMKGDLEKDFYGNPLVPFKLVTRKPIAPSDEEINRNSRARSAKLRVAERI